MSTEKSDQEPQFKFEDSRPALFSYFLSSCSWRVRIVLKWKGVDYQYMTPFEGGNIEPGGLDKAMEVYSKINPAKLVPSLYIDGHLLSESMAIVEYLEETRPDARKLMPKDPFQRALVRKICEHMNSGIQPLQNLRVINKIAEDYQGDKMAWCKYWNEFGLASLEKTLEKTAGKYCVGDEVTLADAFLVPQAWAAFTRFGVNKDNYPTIKRIYDALIELPEFKDASPQNQPDYEA